MDKIILWEIQEFQILKIQLDTIHNSDWKQNDTKVKNERNDTR